MYRLYLFSNTSKSHFRWAATLRASSFKMRFLLLSGGGWTWFCSFTDGFEACSKNWTISCTGGGSAKKQPLFKLFVSPQINFLLQLQTGILSHCHLHSWHCHLADSNPKGHLPYAASNQTIHISLLNFQLYLTMVTTLSYFYLFSLFYINYISVLASTENKCCLLKSQVHCCKNIYLLVILICILKYIYKQLLVLLNTFRRDF